MLSIRHPLSTVPCPPPPQSHDIIFLGGLTTECIIGIWDWERRVKQKVVIDIEMAADIRKAAASDHIDDTLDYKRVSKRLLQFVGDSQFQLVETLTERIAEIVVTEFDVPWVRVRLNKQGAIRGSRDVGILVERRREDYARGPGDEVTAVFVAAGSNIDAGCEPAPGARRARAALSADCAARAPTATPRSASRARTS